ncbi:TadE/TadG family type IV pilus assembly protein [Arthrobacter ruber]|uniref:TadE/TadG family type IV pilus assembly protein n=1 Tax=Arthrobacter ruber TaxID=1258893 RepID=UPI000CF396CF|nr:TadE/TadG family type IV pilus assembly protein [Arthrobacter ruber]
MGSSRERGAAAVEFALLLPVLILILLGIMEFGRAFNTQAVLTGAARESVRVMVISEDTSRAKTAAVTAGVLRPELTASNIAITVPGSTAADPCPAGSTASVTVSYSLSTLTGIAGPFNMTGKGVMLCGG